MSKNKIIKRLDLILVTLEKMQNSANKIQNRFNEVDDIIEKMGANSDKDKEYLANLKLKFEADNNKIMKILDSADN